MNQSLPIYLHSPYTKRYIMIAPDTIEAFEEGSVPKAFSWPYTASKATSLVANYLPIDEGTFLSAKARFISKNGTMDSLKPQWIPSNNNRL